MDFYIRERQRNKGKAIRKVPKYSHKVSILQNFTEDLQDKIQLGKLKMKMSNLANNSASRYKISMTALRKHVVLRNNYNRLYFKS